jgi:DHA3 family macrolide efflux protein-like MFS transporter
MFALANYGTLLVDTVLVPMLRTLFSAYMTNDALIDKMVGNVMSVGGAGMLVGTIAMIAWGGPKRRMHGVLGLLIVIGLFIVLVGGLQPVPLIAMAVFFYFLPFPLMNSCDQAIWQSKVPPDVQGRVFSVRRMMAWSVTPLAYITAGPLADQVFNPLMASNGPLAPSLGPIIGAGPGRGIGLLISLMGLLVILLTLVTALNPRVRNVEDELPNVLPDQVYEDETVMRQVPEAGASP